MNLKSRWLVLPLAVLITGWLCLRPDPTRTPEVPAVVPMPTAGSPPPAGPPPAVALPGARPPSSRRAYRFSLDGDTLRLQASERIHGDFHRQRGPVVRQPGMIYARLLDAGRQVLAEESLPAPDRTCVVLDPNAPDSGGIARLNPAGPAIFQLRLPEIASASALEIYRLGGGEAADNGVPGKLLATIPPAP